MRLSRLTILFQHWKYVRLFVRAIKKIVQNLDGELVRMESSETPTRSYVINFEHNEDYLESVRRNSDRQMSEIIDEVLDRVIE